MEESLPGSRGMGGNQSSIWIFELTNYAALDCLLGMRENPVSQANMSFYSEILDVEDYVKEQTIFL